MNYYNRSWPLKSTSFDPCVSMNCVFTTDECEKIVEYGNSLVRENAKLENTEFNQQIRKGHVSWIDNNQDNIWIFQRVSDAIKQINSQIWNFDLDYIENLQFTIYDEGGDFYSNHIDITTDSFNYRKLSFTIQLSDPEQYYGSNLILNISDFDTVTSKNQGSMTVFPSFLLHRVTPITYGKRYSLVGWACGPKFK